MSGSSNITGDESILFTDNMSFDGTERGGKMTTDGQLWVGSTDSRHVKLGSLTSPGGTITIGYSSPNITLEASGINDLHTARYIVASSTSGTGANYTTIASAIAAAVTSGVNSTIFIQPGTYTENLTISPGINLAAYNGDQATPNVTIVGTITMTAAGTASISNIRLQTNSAALIAVTGSAASILNVNRCYLNCTNATGITYSSSSSSSSLNLNSCTGNIGTTGISLWSHSSAGNLQCMSCNVTNTGGSTTSSTCSAGATNLFENLFSFPITTSGTSTISTNGNRYTTPNTECLTVGGSGGIGTCLYDSFISGTASCISVGSTQNFDFITVNSSNTNAITGAGTIRYGTIDFLNSKIINTTTQTGINSGTFTPAIAFGGGTTGITYTVQEGVYTRVGNMVFYNIRVITSNKGSSTGRVTVTGLPFATRNINNVAVATAGLTLTANYAYVSAASTSGSTTLDINQSPFQSGSYQAVTDAMCANITLLNFSGFYFC